MTAIQLQFEQLKSILVETFEINETIITPDAHLYQDLDIDSIDAVDLLVHIRTLTGRKIKPEEFKAVKTLQDIILVINADTSDQSQRHPLTNNIAPD